MKLESIRKARQRMGWTQTQLAQAVGCRQPTISIIEQGRSKPSEVLWSRIRRALETTEEVDQSPQLSIKIAVPEMPFPAFPTQLPIRVETWIRPEYSGDFIMVHVLSAEQVLLVAMDVAGHAPSIIGKRIYVEGWLRGWLKNQTTAPRIQGVVDAISDEFRNTGIQAAAFFAMIALDRSMPHTVSYEAAACGFPSPLLLAGSAFRTIESAAANPPLPNEHGLTLTTRIERLSAPWRMVIASDGLLSRLGGGTEFEGIKVLRRWQSGRDRNGPPDRNLTTDQLAIDDELFALLEWNGWDREMEFEVHEQTEYERAVAALDAKIRNVLGGKIADGFKQALAEVVNNAWRHGYAGQKGRLKIRFREEAQCFRVEVEDMGKGGITEKAIKKGQSGFAIIHSNCANVHVRNGRERGSVVELTIEKSPNPGSDDRK